MWRGGGTLPAPSRVPGGFQVAFLGCAGAAPCAGQRKSVMEGNQSSGVAVETGGETRGCGSQSGSASGAWPGEGWHRARVPCCGPGGLLLSPFWDVPKGSCCWHGWFGVVWGFFGSFGVFWGLSPPHLCCAPCPSTVWEAQESPFIKSWNSSMVWVG